MPRLIQIHARDNEKKSAYWKKNNEGNLNNEKYNTNAI